MKLQDIYALDSVIQIGSRSKLTHYSVDDDWNPASYIAPEINSNTDWDYSAQYSVEAHEYLCSKGYDFYSVDDLAEYGDDQVAGIYIKQLDSDTTVNIILHKDEQLFRRVWASITPRFFYEYIWKRSPTYAGLDLYDTKIEIKRIMNQLYRTASNLQ